VEMMISVYGMKGIFNRDLDECSCVLQLFNLREIVWRKR
jgi:hypothetical protein